MKWLRGLSPVYLTLPAVAIALLWLGRLSYRYSHEFARRVEEREREDLEALGQKAIDRVENLIIDADRTLFSLVNLDSQREFAQLWTNLVRVSPALEVAVVLDDQRKIVHFLSKEKKDAARRFEQLFSKRILPDLELEDLRTWEHRHLHKEYDGRYYLVSYTRRESMGRTFYVAIKTNVDYLVGEIFREEFVPLRPHKRVAVVDEQGRRVYGETVAQGTNTFEAKFPTTLYLWTLRMEPRAAGVLGAEARKRRVADVVLIGLSLAVAAAGLFGLAYAVRNERRLSEMKGEFIANVSHELKTPLSLIRMFGELIATGRVRGPDVAREYGEIITRESERLSRLIDNVLDFSRMERGRDVFEFSVGDLREVVERGLDVYRYRLEREKVRLATEIGEDLPPVRMDENAMTLVLLNLVENAIRYGVREIGDEIAVRLACQDGHVRLSVADRGPGIRSMSKRVFERFYRARRRTQPIRVGISLSLVSTSPRRTEGAFG